MLHVPSAPAYTWRLDSTTGRPGAAFGTSITPSGTANTYTSYTQLIAGASVTEDVWFIEINVNSAAISAAARNMIATIGIDTAGGTSYTDTINHLLVTGAAPHNTPGGGVWYAFPLFIPAGSSIGMKVSQNSTNTTAINAFVRLYGRPTHPETTPVGHYVETLGATTASSSGTTITPGTTSEGSYVFLANTTRSAWWWQVGWGSTDTTMTAAVLYVDVSVAATSRLVIENYPIHTTAAEQITQPLLVNGCSLHVPIQAIYARAQSSAAVDTGQSVAVYALGG